MVAVFGVGVVHVASSCLGAALCFGLGFVCGATRLGGRVVVAAVAPMNWTLSMPLIAFFFFKKF
jgi:hypothetical protein